jgi:hypothetical protein
MVSSFKNDPKDESVNDGSFCHKRIRTNKGHFIYIAAMIPLISFENSLSLRLRLQTTKGSILINPKLLYWFLFFSENLNKESAKP